MNPSRVFTEVKKVVDIEADFPEMLFWEPQQYRFFFEETAALYIDTTDFYEMLHEICAETGDREIYVIHRIEKKKFF
ncbi:hypothetical protein MFLO_01110 [Listeria floridensis FSL S10-1187]|uniref:Uncharacterized protein n=1 Tax=Listeria floridensis FSL S10-1187 TaxID=1265817 RepID=A0ABP3B1N6_9LIST|nr:hypothetical protein [Listeria floridensis]EUJ33788.1 hypothetical protein MFLO_01110 [Listeria floridensis FSL S10-1187]